MWYVKKKKKEKRKKKKEKLQTNVETSCPSDQCLNEGQCSTRLNGNYYCECAPWASGIQCEIG